MGIVRRAGLLTHGFSQTQSTSTCDMLIDGNFPAASAGLGIGFYDGAGIPCRSWDLRRSRSVDRSVGSKFSKRDRSRLLSSDHVPLSPASDHNSRSVSMAFTLPYCQLSPAAIHRKLYVRFRSESHGDCHGHDHDSCPRRSCPARFATQVG